MVDQRLTVGCVWLTGGCLYLTLPYLNFSYLIEGVVGGENEGLRSPTGLCYIVGMSKPKIQRNKELVEKRDKKGYSFRKLAAFYGISHPTAIEIYHREKVARRKKRR